MPPPAQGSAPPLEMGNSFRRSLWALPSLRGREQVLPWDRLGLGGGRGRELVSLEVGALPMPYPASLSSHLLFRRDKQLADKLSCHTRSHQGPASLHGLPSSPHFPLSLCFSGLGPGLLSWSPFPLCPGSSPGLTSLFPKAGFYF